MATVKRYQILCPKCHHNFPVFAALYHTVDVDQWIKEHAEAHDCSAYAAALEKSRAPRLLNPIKASKKGK